MSETPGEHLTEEPQEERGPMGSRDTGSDQPAGGPADRPVGGPDEECQQRETQNVKRRFTIHEVSEGCM